MLSLPPEVVERLDALAARTGQTRSGLVAQLAADADAGEREALLRETRACLALAGHYGGDEETVALIKASRR